MRCDSAMRSDTSARDRLQHPFYIALMRAYLALGRRDSATALAQFGTLPDSICDQCAMWDITYAQLLEAKGRDRDALRVLSILNVGSDTYSTMMLLERARVAERLGEKAIAVDGYLYVAEDVGEGRLRVPAIREGGARRAQAPGRRERAGHQDRRHRRDAVARDAHAVHRDRRAAARARHAAPDPSRRRHRTAGQGRARRRPRVRRRRSRRQVVQRRRLPRRSSAPSSELGVDGASTSSRARAPTARRGCACSPPRAFDLVIGVGFIFTDDVDAARAANIRTCGSPASTTRSLGRARAIVIRRRRTSWRSSSARRRARSSSARWRRWSRRRRRSASSAAWTSRSSTSSRPATRAGVQARVPRLHGARRSTPASPPRRSGIPARARSSRSPVPAGADIIFHASGSTGLGVFEAARADGQARDRRRRRPVRARRRGAC